MSIKKTGLPLALCMIQPEPYPRSYRSTGISFQEVMGISIREVEMIQNTSFDGYITQNCNDVPVKQIASPETVAYMSVLSYGLERRFLNVIQGILVDWNGVASLAVANVVWADFIRIEYTYVGMEIGYAGLMHAQCVDICMIRKRLGSYTLVYADVQEIHCERIDGEKIVGAIWDSVQNAFVGGLFIDGRVTGESIQIYHDVHRRLGDDVPLFLSAGPSSDSIREILTCCDGVNVGTWVRNGNMKNPIDPEKARILTDGVKEVRRLHNNR